MIRAWVASAVAILAVLNAGNARSASKDLVFNEHDSSGLILVGLQSTTPFRNASQNWLVFGRYNPSTTSLIDPSAARPKLDITGVNRKLQYFLLKVRPGPYVIRSVHTRRLVLCLNKGTMAFEVDPGKITYIGNIELRRTGIGFVGMKVEEARNAVLKYPGVRGVLKPALDLKRTRFSAGGDAAGAKAACTGIHFR